MASPGRLGKFLQLGYVCRDIERAKATFAERCGVPEFAMMVGPMPQFGREPVQKIAMAFRGDVMIELIEPPTDVPTVYTHALPPDQVSARLHHLAYVAEDEAEWERIQAHHARLGNACVAAADLEAIRYCYFDTVADTGHMTEYFLPAEQMLAFWASLPRFP
jgi:hypothetical protein